MTVQFPKGVVLAILQNQPIDSIRGFILLQGAQIGAGAEPTPWPPHFNH